MTTDWRSEIETQLLRSKIYQAFKEKAHSEGDAIEAQVTEIVFRGVKDAYEKAKLIIKYMPEYTLHDAEHLFRVLYNMDRLITEQNIKQLSVPDMMLLILSAFFHDLGMAPYEYEIRAWKQNWVCEVPNDTEAALFGQFDRFRRTYPDKLDEISRLRAKGLNSKASLLEDYLISEYIRTTHAQRAREILSKEWASKVKYQDADLTAELASLCFSHNADAMELLKMDSALLCGENVITNLRFVGMILRLADLLDFDAKRTPSVLFSHLAVKNPVSIDEWQKHRAVQGWDIVNDMVVYSIKCKHPAIEASVRKFCDYIDDELKNCGIILSKMDPYSPYKISLPIRVSRDKIEAVRDIASGEPVYYYEDTSFELNKNQVIELLMGTKLYGKPEVALRELIQNSRDACKLSQALHEKWMAPYIPEITVKYYSVDNEDFLEVNDNGMGMNKEIIDKYYARVGSSFYKSRDFFELKANSDLEFNPVSEFGIGILSCFMVADSLEVETKRIKDQYDYDKPIKVVIEGHDSIFTILKSDKKSPGTSTKLLLREKNPWKKMSAEQFIQAVKNVIPNPPFNINIQTDKENIRYSGDDFKSRAATELKDYNWPEDENVKEICFAITAPGFHGNVVVALLEQDGNPVKAVNKLSKEVEIDDETFELSMEIRIHINEIEKRSTTIDINDEGEVKSSSHVSRLAKSKSSFSLFGITYAGSLFPDYFMGDRKAVLRWPFPMLIILDVEGENGLDLNSARNEIIYNEKWNRFETNLAFLVCDGLKNELDPAFWSQLVPILSGGTDSENFKAGLEKVLTR